MIRMNHSSRKRSFLALSASSKLMVLSLLRLLVLGGTLDLVGYKQASYRWYLRHLPIKLIRGLKRRFRATET